MSKAWHCREFSAKETIVGHGAESIGRQVRNFLQKENITDKQILFSTYLVMDGVFRNEPVVRAILLYRK
jgi:hypothetical protein